MGVLDFWKESRSRRNTGNSLMESFRSENWSKMNADERLAALQKLENFTAGQEGRTARTVVPEKMENDSTYGYFNESSSPGSLHINEKLLNGNGANGGYDAMDTLWHEGRHAYQYDAYSGRLLSTANPPDQNTQELWKANFDNDIYRSSGTAYYYQPIEADANRFARDKMKENESYFAQDPAYEKYQKLVEAEQTYYAESLDNMCGGDYEKQIADEIRQDYQERYAKGKDGRNKEISDINWSTDDLSVDKSKRFIMNSQATMLLMRERMSEEGQMRFDEALASGDNPHVHLQREGEEYYMTGKASGRYLSKENPGETAQERKENLQLPPENDAEDVFKVRSTQARPVVVSTIKPQEEFAEKSGYQAKSGMEQTITPTLNGGRPIDAGMYEYVSDDNKEKEKVPEKAGERKNKSEEGIKEKSPKTKVEAETEDSASKKNKDAKGEGESKKNKETKGESEPKENKEVKAEDEPKENKETKDESEPQENKKAKAEDEPKENKEVKAESEPKENKEAKGESEPKAEKETKGESEPKENKEAKGESEPKAEKETKGESEPKENKEARAEDEPKENKEAKAESEPKENKEAKAEDEPKENKEAKAEKEPKENKEAKAEDEPKENKEARAESEPKPEKTSEKESAPSRDNDYYNGMGY